MPDQDSQRTKDDHEVEFERHLFDVVQIQEELPPGVLDGTAVTVVDLGPAGQARFDQVPFIIVGDLANELLNELRSLRSRADDRHVAKENVPQLGQLIKQMSLELGFVDGLPVIMRSDRALLPLNLRAQGRQFQGHLLQGLQRIELEALGRERTEAASAVPSSTLSIFDRVAERHDGEALARVIQPHPKRQEFMCDGCNMSVTLEQFVTLRAGTDIQVCNSCGRVLFLDD